MTATGGRGDTTGGDDRASGGAADANRAGGDEFEREAGGEIVRGIDAGRYLEALLISAVAAVLAIRAFLALTGYPQIGTGGLHIAHMLWGGFLMLAALVVALSFLGARARWVTAIVGGVGFGTFIDELGKFVTADNNYFFQPAIALIYLVFIGLFFAFEAIEERLLLSPRARLANAADELAALVADGERPGQVERARHLLAPGPPVTPPPDDLARVGQSPPPPASLSAGLSELQALFGVPGEPDRRIADPLDQALRAAATVAAESSPSRLARSVGAVRRTFRRLIRSPHVQQIVVMFFVAEAFVYVGIAVVSPIREGLAANLLRDANSFFGVLELASSLFASGLVLVGVARFPTSRLAAYRWFRRAVLVAILVVQVGLFYRNQLAAIFGLAVDLLLLGLLDQMIAGEVERGGADDR